MTKTPSLDPPDPADVAPTLQVPLSEMPQALIAVLDGTLFDGLPDDLVRDGELLPADDCNSILTGPSVIQAY
jgi:hypothetical protein